MRLQYLLASMLLALPAAAQQSVTTPRATVSGVVHDSVSHMVLAGARVQLAATDGSASFSRTAISDSLGKFTLADVPDGKYALGFFHPVQDSLGLEPTLRAVHVDRQRSVNADLAIPSPIRLRSAICGKSAAGAVLVGIVRDARTNAALEGATVTAEWLELAFTRGGLVRQRPLIMATTRENGWFAMCNVPSPGTMMVAAYRGTDSTDRVEVQITEQGFVRRELFLGASHPDRQPGEVRLSGTVIAATAGQPVAGAQVGFAGGPHTLSNEKGEWTIYGAPTGTRVLEVRAVGFYPDRRRVDVVAGAPAVTVPLATLKVILDTMKVNAKSLGFGGFEERRRGGAGRYLTPKDIERMKPLVTGDLFRNLPGLHVESDGKSAQMSMRGPFGQCSPVVWLNGARLGDHLSLEDFNTFMNPGEILGIETYSEASAPPQFKLGVNGSSYNSIDLIGLDMKSETWEAVQSRVGVNTSNNALNCGAIVIWMK